MVVWKSSCNVITVQKDKVLLDPGSLHAPLSNFLEACFNFKKVLTSNEVVLASKTLTILHGREKYHFWLLLCRAEFFFLQILISHLLQIRLTVRWKHKCGKQKWARLCLARAVVEVCRTVPTLKDQLPLVYCVHCSSGSNRYVLISKLQRLISQCRGGNCRGRRRVIPTAALYQIGSVEGRGEEKHPGCSNETRSRRPCQV